MLESKNEMLGVSILFGFLSLYSIAWIILLFIWEANMENIFPYSRDNYSEIKFISQWVHYGIVFHIWSSISSCFSSIFLLIYSPKEDVAKWDMIFAGVGFSYGVSYIGCFVVWLALLINTRDSKCNDLWNKANAARLLNNYSLQWEKWGYNISFSLNKKDICENLYTKCFNMSWIYLLVCSIAGMIISFLGDIIDNPTD